MEFKTEEYNDNKICKVYSIMQLFNYTSILTSIYSLSKDDDIEVKYIKVDEPFGMDSAWKHHKGKLTDNIELDEFVNLYKELDIESVTMRATYKDISFALYVLPQTHELKIVHNVDADADSVADLELKLASYVPDL